MKLISTVLLLFLVFPLVQAATLSGTIYDAHFDVTSNVLVEINSIPAQKVLSTDGTYSFSLPMGEYVLTARTAAVQISESVTIAQDGEFVYDLFLIPDFSEEDELWLDSEEELFGDEIVEEKATWPAVLLFVLIVIFVYFYRKKTQKKTVEKHKEELDNEPGDLEKVVDIIKKHDGRISQKDLRKEMLPLSEAKVSLLVTELEHNDKIEKVKKGRGNVLILK